MSKVFSKVTFESQFAVEHGIYAALIYHHIDFLCQWENPDYFYEGKFWVRASINQFKKVFPFMSLKTIQNYLDYLIEKGLIVKSTFNHKKTDRTCWYSTYLKPIENAEEISKENDSHLVPGAKSDLVPDAKCTIYINKTVIKKATTENQEIQTAKRPPIKQQQQEEKTLSHNSVKNFELMYSEEFQKIKVLLLSYFLTFKINQIIKIQEYFETSENLNSMIEDFLNDEKLSKLSPQEMKSILAAKILCIIGEK